jgi:alanine racemase
MDQTVVDVSGLHLVQPADEVVLIGEQGRDRITANELAAWCETIPWEVLTNITYRVPRIYRGSQAA